MYERKHQTLERKVTGISPRHAMPEAAYQDREVAAGWLKHQMRLKFNPNHDERGRFDFGSGDGGDGNAWPITSPNWPKTPNARLNIDKATQYATDNVVSPTTSPNGERACAQHVREALRAGGINIPAAGINAKDYGPVLEKYGFKPLDPTPAPNYSPMKGDIVVIQNTSASKFGHIAIYNGSNWISDFKQPGFWPSSTYRSERPSYKIYR